MTTALAINGFGRIGRHIVRQLFSHPRRSELKLVAINDITSTAELAHLFKYDSVHGKFSGDVTHDDNSLTINGQKIAVLAKKNPAELPWRDMGAGLVLECSGLFTSKEKAGAHFSAGAKKVIISAPATDPDLTVVMGVNHAAYSPAAHNLLSCASCTTNCLAPVAKVLLENFGIMRGTMTTVHSYTNDQRILDLPHKDLRRARAAAVSMIPTTTGAAKAVGLVLPALNGKVDGFAIRVPTVDVSIVDFVVELECDANKEDINRALKSAADGALKGILGYCDEPLVSVDFTGDPRSSIVDGLSTMVVGKRMAKVISWYDNEIGFSTRMIDLALLVGSKL